VIKAKPVTRGVEKPGFASVPVLICGWVVKDCTRGKIRVVAPDDIGEIQKKRCFAGLRLGILMK
jgi:hypothetical protein